eukprot:TRINITY_DN16740_c0_g1_i1.p1 TRINITY_DN16740_c0_g1~~TRINITY_DN16740_c0_g1_i1.p1  ORF type:complete len:429 (+),score=111.23 TRINITY_DN16740_c0_g1_i1:38-1324(+)
MKKQKLNDGKEKITKKKPTEKENDIFLKLLKQTIGEEKREEIRNNDNWTKYVFVFNKEMEEEFLNYIKTTREEDKKKEKNAKVLLLSLASNELFYKNYKENNNEIEICFLMNKKNYDFNDFSFEYIEEQFPLLVFQEIPVNMFNDTDFRIAEISYSSFSNHDNDMDICDDSGDSSNNNNEVFNVDIIDANDIIENHEKSMELFEKEEQKKNNSSSSSSKQQRFVETFVKKSLNDAGSLAGDKIESTFQSKVNQRRLQLDNPPPISQQDVDEGIKQKKRLERRKNSKMSRKEKKKKNFFEIDNSIKFEDCKQLNALWISYINDILSNQHSFNLIGNILIRADLHGAIIKVIKSKTVNQIGLYGIVIQETKNVFKIITPDDKIKILPKKMSVFGLVIKDKFIQIFGNNFCYRSSERSVYKFKQQKSIALD